MTAENLTVADEVTAALRDGEPIVALESIIIAQGFPRPDNLAVAVTRNWAGGWPWR